jgi:hypothetical protein
MSSMNVSAAIPKIVTGSMARMICTTQKPGSPAGARPRDAAFRLSYLLSRQPGETPVS